MAQVTPQMISDIQKQYDKQASLIKPKTATELATAHASTGGSTIEQQAKMKGMTVDAYLKMFDAPTVASEQNTRLQQLNALARDNTGVLADVYNAKSYATPSQLASAGKVMSEFGYGGSVTPSTYQGDNQAIIEGNLLANPLGNPEDMTREQALAYNRGLGTTGTGTTQTSLAAPPTYNPKTMVFDTANNIPTTSTTTSTPSTATDLQSKLLEAQKAATLAGLETARQTGLSSLQSQEDALTPQFAQQRSQARAQSERGAKSFAEFLATRGLTNSGGAALGETNRLGALQGTIGGLQQQEQSQLGEINRLRTLANQNYATGVQGADATMNAQNYQNLIDAQTLADQRAYQEGLTADQRAYNESLTNTANAATQETNDKNAWLNTIGQFSNNYQGEYNRVANDGDPTNDWQLPYLQAARQDKINQLGLDQQGNPIVTAPTNTVPQITSSSAALQLWEQLGTANEAIAQALGIPVGTKYTQAMSGGSGGSNMTTPTTTSNDFDRTTATSIINNIMDNTNLTNTSPNGKITFNKDGVMRQLTALASDPTISDATLDYLASYFGL